VGEVICRGTPYLRTRRDTAVTMANGHGSQSKQGRELAQ
jgi:hypothetical protein